MTLSLNQFKSLLINIIFKSNYGVIVQSQFDISTAQAYNASMLAQSEQLESNTLQALSSDLEALSYRYGPIYKLGGYYISNDQGFIGIGDSLAEHMHPTNKGIGIFIGAGGVPSI